MNYNIPESCPEEPYVGNGSVAVSDVRICESCQKAEALLGDTDCLACNIEGELEWIQCELREAA